MAPKNTNSGKGRTSRPGRTSRYSGDNQPRYLGREVDPKWTTNVAWKPPRKISDEVLQKAKAMFFALDKDSSGSIDADELGVMLRSLGQNPSEEELQALIDSVDGDGGEKDGKIQLREFLKLYADAMGDPDAGNKVGKEDIVNVFCSMGGDSKVPDAKVQTDTITSSLLEQFNLQVDLKDVFGVKDNEISKELMAEILGADAALVASPVKTGASP